MKERSPIVQDLSKVFRSSFQQERFYKGLVIVKLTFKNSLWSHFQYLSVIKGLIVHSASGSENQSYLLHGGCCSLVSGVKLVFMCTAF